MAKTIAAIPTTTRLRTTAKLFDCIQIINSEHAKERKKAERDADIIVTYKLIKIITKHIYLCILLFNVFLNAMLTKYKVDKAAAQLVHIA